MKATAFLLLSLLSASAIADDDFSVMAGLWSYHWDAAPVCGKRDCNESNDMIGIESGNIFAATMINSFNRRSYWLGVVTDKRCWSDYICADISAALATGYPDAEIVPFIAPRVIIGADKGLQLQLFGMPGYIMGAGFRYEF